MVHIFIFCQAYSLIINRFTKVSYASFCFFWDLIAMDFLQDKPEIVQRSIAFWENQLILLKWNLSEWIIFITNPSCKSCILAFVNFKYCKFTFINFAYSHYSFHKTKVLTKNYGAQQKPLTLKFSIINVWNTVLITYPKISKTVFLNTNDC